MSRFSENVVRHVITTIMGAILLLAAIGLALEIVVNGWEVNFLNITLIVVFVSAGTYLLGAEGFISEITKFLASVNGIFGALFRKPK